MLSASSVIGGIVRALTSERTIEDAGASHGAIDASGHSSWRAARGAAATVWRHVGFILTAVALALDAVLTPILAPAARVLARLAIVQKIERGVAACPAYVVLVLVAAPYLLRQGVKLLAVALAGSGDPIAGALVYLGSRMASMLVAKRIYDAGRDKLLTIGWFESVHDWIERRSEKRIEAFRSSRVYGIGSRWSRRVARWLGITGARAS